MFTTLFNFILCNLTFMLLSLTIIFYRTLVDLNLEFIMFTIKTLFSKFAV